jgi:hypothetical protein
MTGGSGKAEGLADGVQRASQAIGKLRLPLPPDPDTRECRHKGDSNGSYG